MISVFQFCGPVESRHPTFYELLVPGRSVFYSQIPSRFSSSFTPSAAGLLLLLLSNTDSATSREFHFLFKHCLQNSCPYSNPPISLTFFLLFFLPPFLISPLCSSHPWNVQAPVQILWRNKNKTPLFCSFLSSGHDSGTRNVVRGGTGNAPLPLALDK